MATNISSISLLQTIEWAKKLNFNRPSVLGNFLEPALTCANMVRQAMLGAPFGWWWNSKTVSFNTDPNQSDPQDYIVNVPDFGWIDTVAVKDVVQTPNKWIQMSVKMSLSIDSVSARPSFISPLNQDTETGDVTFRLMPVPNKPYPVSMVIQQASPLFTKVSQTWAPIPDYLSYIYNWGFLSLMWAYADDGRWTMANQKFIAHLLGAAQGLDETAKNIFLNNWGNLTSGQNIAQTQGFQARGT